MIERVSMRSDTLQIPDEIWPIGHADAALWDSLLEEAQRNIDIADNVLLVGQGDAAISRRAAAPFAMKQLPMHLRLWLSILDTADIAGKFLGSSRHDASCCPPLARLDLMKALSILCKFRFLQTEHQLTGPSARSTGFRPVGRELPAASAVLNRQHSRTDGPNSAKANRARGRLEKSANAEAPNSTALFGDVPCLTFIGAAYRFLPVTQPTQ